MTCHPWQGHYCGRRAGSGLPLTVTFRCRWNCCRLCRTEPALKGLTAVAGALIPDQAGTGNLPDKGDGRRYCPFRGKRPRGSCPRRAGRVNQPETVTAVRRRKNFQLHDALLHPRVGSDNQRNPAGGFLLQQLRAHLRTRASRIHGVMTCCSSPPGLVSLGH